MIPTRLEIAAGDHPTLEGDDVLYCDLRDCGLRPFVRCDVFAPLPFASGQFTAIRANHILEHAPWADAYAILAEWVRVLGEPGIIRVETPDLAWQAQQVLNDPTNREMVRFIYGGQDMPDECNLHRGGFTLPMLVTALKEAGLATGRVWQGVGCLVGEGWRNPPMTRAVFKDWYQRVMGEEAIGIEEMMGP